MRTPPVKDLSDKKPPTGTSQNGELEIKSDWSVEQVWFLWNAWFGIDNEVVSERVLRFCKQLESQAYQRGREEEREKIISDLGSIGLRKLQKTGLWEDHGWDDLVGSSQTTCLRHVFNQGVWKEVQKALTKD